MADKFASCTFIPTLGQNGVARSVTKRHSQWWPGLVEWVTGTDCTPHLPSIVTMVLSTNLFTTWSRSKSCWHETTWGEEVRWKTLVYVASSFLRSLSLIRVPRQLFSACALHTRKQRVSRLTLSCFYRDIERWKIKTLLLSINCCKGEIKIRQE